MSKLTSVSADFSPGGCRSEVEALSRGRHSLADGLHSSVSGWRASGTPLSTCNATSFAYAPTFLPAKSGKTTITVFNSDS